MGGRRPRRSAEVISRHQFGDPRGQAVEAIIAPEIVVLGMWHLSGCAAAMRRDGSDEPGVGATLMVGGV